MTDTPQELARSLRALVEAHATATDEANTMVTPVVDGIANAGLFRLMVPESFGGLEANVATIVDVCAELGYADGATGWAYAQNITVGACTAYLDPDIGQSFATRKAGAGMFAPLGVAHDEGAQLRVSGRYPFGSGSGHADYIGGGALVMIDGEIAPVDEHGSMPVIGYLVPMKNAQLKGNWDVMGLRGTGSFDFEIPEQLVDIGATWHVLAPGIARWHSGGAIFGLGSMTLGTLSSAGWAVGVAERALDEVRGIAIAGRARMGSDPLAEQVTFQRGLGFHTVAVEAARTQIKHSYQAAVEGVVADLDHESFQAKLRHTRASAKYVTEVAKAAVTFAWEQSGSAGMRNPSLLQRCFRDIYMGAGHQVFDDRNYLELAKGQLGVDTAGF